MATFAELGITGRVGSRIGAELLRRGHKDTGPARTVQGVPSQPDLTVKALDAADNDALVAALRGNDAVISAMRFVGGIVAPDHIAVARRRSLAPGRLASAQRYMPHQKASRSSCSLVAPSARRLAAD